jgi:hypothetical protein
MISFRYHLVSIVAVLLALAIGIVLGSGFIGGVILERLERDVDNVTRTNQELRNLNAEQDRTLETYEEFARAAQADFVGSALATRQVVVFTMQGTDQATLDGLEEAVGVAGGSVAATIRVTDKVEMRDPEDRGELAAILDARVGSANELRRELGIALGAAAAAVAAPEPPARREGAGPTQDLENLLRKLTDGQYIALERPPGAAAVPPLAMFLVVVGGSDVSPPRPMTFARPLATNLAQRNRAVVVAEPSTSVWGIVARLRTDERMVDEVSTVDNAETIPGRVAAVIGLRRAAQGRVGHYGSGPGAEDLLPRPASLAG